MAKKEKLMNILFEKVASNPIIDSANSEYYLPFYKEPDYFESYEATVKFIKSVEKMVRKHSFYRKYISYLIEIVGMNTCQVLSNIEVQEKVTHEMHHGPMLTLFDIVSIVLNDMLYKGESITTFSVTKKVLEEHRLNNVRVVLVTKTVHQQIHDDNIFLHYKQGFGDTRAFLEKYRDGVDKSIIIKINEYIQWCEQNDSFDNEVLKIQEDMKLWGHNDFLMEDYD